MSLLEELKDLGVNVEEGMERLMGNTALYEKMLVSFTKMIKTSSLQPDFDCEDYKETTEQAHAIKGAAGNLSITPLYEAYTEIVNLLRSDHPEQAQAVLKNILPVQNKIINCIENHI